MAYNNVFPVGYQPAQMYYPQQMQQPQQPQDSDIKWVLGEAGAKSWFVPPGKTVALWDSETQTIYLKSADPVGIPSIRILDYTIRDSEPQRQTPLSPQVDYATKEDVGMLQGELNNLRDEINRMASKGSKKEVKRDE